jgi:hypothetical protein
MNYYFIDLQLTIKNREQNFSQNFLVSSIISLSRPRQIIVNRLLTMAK